MDLNSSCKTEKAERWFGFKGRPKAKRPRTEVLSLETFTPLEVGNDRFFE
jgi:hypothetical protein